MIFSFYRNAYTSKDDSDLIDIQIECRFQIKAADVFKRSYDDSLTFANFEGIKIDGNKITRSKYDVEEGSLILELKAGLLESLSEGSHELEVSFKDGSCKTYFSIKKDPNDKPHYVLPVIGVE